MGGTRGGGGVVGGGVVHFGIVFRVSGNRVDREISTGLDMFLALRL